MAIIAYLGNVDQGAESAYIAPPHDIAVLIFSTSPLHHLQSSIFYHVSHPPQTLDLLLGSFSFTGASWRFCFSLFLHLQTLFSRISSPGFLLPSSLG